MLKKPADCCPGAERLEAGGGDGGKAHSLDEWWTNKEGHKAIQLALLILLMESGME